MGQPGTFLHELSESSRSAFEERAVVRTWPAGATLFHEGDRADRVIVITKGAVKAVAVSESGVESGIAVRGPGEILGELGVIAGEQRSASVVALDAVEALVVTADSFREFLRNDGDAAYVLLERLAARVRDASRRQAEFGTLESSIRLARLLVELAETYGEECDEGIRLRLLSQDELASLCGASREAIARSLRTFRDAGLVATGRKSITLIDTDGLACWTPSDGR